MGWGPRVHRLRFFAADAWDEWRRSPGANFLALATVASTLFLAGLLILVVWNLKSRVQEQRDDVRMEIYLAERIPEGRRATLRRRLEAAEGVARVEYVDKQEALRRYRQWAGEMGELIEELETNPLPASLEVFLEPGPEAESLGTAIAEGLVGFEGIEEVRFDREWLRRLESLLELASLGGGGLAVLVFAAVIFVIANVLRLAVLARKEEIEIMLLVGATPGFIRGPFLVAGLAQGLIASGLALLVVELVRRTALAYAGRGSLVLLDLVAARPIPLSLSLVLVAIGLTVSLTASYFAVRRTV